MKIDAVGSLQAVATFFRAPHCGALLLVLRIDLNVSITERPELGDSVDTDPSTHIISSVETGVYR